MKIYLKKNRQQIVRYRPYSIHHTCGKGECCLEFSSSRLFSRSKIFSVVLSDEFCFVSREKMYEKTHNSSRIRRNGFLFFPVNRYFFLLSVFAVSIYFILHQMELRFFITVLYLEVSVT